MNVIIVKYFWQVVLRMDIGMYTCCCARGIHTGLEDPIVGSKVLKEIPVTPQAWDVDCPFCSTVTYEVNFHLTLGSIAPPSPSPFPPTLPHPQQVQFDTMLLGGFHNEVIPCLLVLHVTQQWVFKNIF